ncbi:hypothetical protein [Pseudoduganella chitinolytica]|uniref:DUF4148 domain-containing protein n=1 Tax=Pseudoduganella chitinolytica TaxID=34070 RepID=A0ABY8B7H1_9BURK|nr:hypothetical protein [Pseudoduganella chitinolytica]WEF30697.1 hypothetical protein PX653_14550 [Pseudoduganella chitinolytica]
MSKILTKAVFVASGIALLQFSAAATAQVKSVQEKTVAVKAEQNMARGLAGPVSMTREQRLAAKPLDPSVTRGKPGKQSELSAEEKSALAAAKPQLTDGGEPNSSADDEARRDFSEEWKTMDQQDR